MKLAASGWKAPLVNSFDLRTGLADFVHEMCIMPDRNNARYYNNTHPHTQVSTIKLFYDPSKLSELSDSGSTEYHYGYPKRYIKKY